MKNIEQFIKGFRVFQKNYFGADSSHFDGLKKGQNPKTMIIGCSDSRVDPAILTNSEPGDIFVVRNVANLVPPYETASGQHGVSAALEFAVCFLKVSSVVVLGHSQCGGINALMTDNAGIDESVFLSRWMSIADSVKTRVVEQLKNEPPEKQQRAAEQAAILLSIENLHSFPFINDRIASGELTINGLYFDLHSGELYGYDCDSGTFEIIHA